MGPVLMFFQKSGAILRIIPDSDKCMGLFVQKKPATWVEVAGFS